MREINIKDKEKYLKENYPFQIVPKLENEMVCMDCDTIFKVEQYKVFKNPSGKEFICCPNAPECLGTVLDWIPSE